MQQNFKWIVIFCVTIGLVIYSTIFFYIFHWFLVSPYILPFYPHPVSLVGVSGSNELSIISGGNTKRVNVENGVHICPPISRVSQDVLLINMGKTNCLETVPAKLNIQTQQLTPLGTGLRAVASPDGKTMYYVSNRSKSGLELEDECLLMKRPLDAPDTPPTVLHATFCSYGTGLRASIPPVVFDDGTPLFTDGRGMLSEIGESGHIRRLVDINVRILPIFVHEHKYYGYKPLTPNYVESRVLQELDYATDTLTDYDLDEDDEAYFIALDKAHNAILYTTTCRCRPYRQCSCLYAYDMNSKQKYIVAESDLTGGIGW